MTRWTILVAAALAAPSAAFAQPAQTSYVLPASTHVPLITDVEISSATNKPGDRFAFHVAEDVKQGEVVLIPAGSVGEGEVVDAARAKNGGRGGKLVLAARFVTVDGRPVQLRSFTAGGGKDRSNASYAVTVAASGWAMFMRGGEIVIPAGTGVAAKTSEDVELRAAGNKP